MNSEPEIAGQQIRSSGELKQTNATSFTTGVKVGSSFVLITDQPAPLLLDLSKPGYTPFQVPAQFNLVPTCIAAAPDDDQIATGYADGTIAFWSVRTCGQTSKFKTAHQSKIIHIGFLSGADSLHVGDQAGIVTHVEKRPLAFSEKQILDAPVPVSGFAGFRDGLKVGFAIARTVVYVLDLTRSGEEEVAATLPLTEGSSAYVPKLVTVVDNGNHFLFVYGLPKMLIYHVKAAGDVKLERSVAFSPDEAINSLEVVRDLTFIALTSRRLVRFLSFSDQVFANVKSDVLPDEDVIQRRHSTMARAMFGATQFSFLLGYDLIAFTRDSVVRVKFSSWKNGIVREITHGWYPAAIQGLLSAREGRLRDCIGLPPNNGRLFRILRELGAVVLRGNTAALIDGPESRVIRGVLDLVPFAIEIGLASQFALIVFDVFAERNKLNLFYPAFLTDVINQSTPRLVTPAFIERLLQVPGLRDVETLLRSIDYHSAYVREIAQIAFDCGLFRLCETILVDEMQEFTVAAQIALEHDHLLDFLEPIFASNKKYGIKALSIWLLCPADGHPPPIVALIQVSVERTAKILSQVLKLLPIPISNSAKMTVSDAVRSVLPDLLLERQFDVDKMIPILDVVGPYLNNHDVQLTGAAILFGIEWVFRSSCPQVSREQALRHFLENCPGVLPAEDIEGYKTAGGFLSVLLPKFLPDQQFSMLIAAFVLSPEHYTSLIAWLESQLPGNEAELQAGILQRFEGLLLVNATLILRFLVLHFREMHEAFYNMIQDSYLEYVFLRNLHDVDRSYKGHSLRAFDLVCQYDPPAALPYLKDVYDTVDIAAAQKIAGHWSAGACLIYIAKLSGTGGADATAAFMDALLDFAELGDNNDFECDSDEEFGRFQQLEAPLGAIDCAIELIADNVSIWERFTEAFTFPLYHAAKVAGKKNLGKTMQLLFAYFLVALLDLVDPVTLFTSLLVQIQVFDPTVFRSLVEMFLRQLDYKLSTSALVRSMSVLEREELMRKSFALLNYGMSANTGGLCCTCGKFLQLSATASSSSHAGTLTTRPSIAAHQWISARYVQSSPRK
jgi:hypothetical protein